MKNIHLAIAIPLLFALILLSAESLSDEGIYHEDTNLMTKLEIALTEKGIPYTLNTLHDGRVYISWKDQYSDRVKPLVEAAFKVERLLSPPVNSQQLFLNLSFLERIESSGIPYQIEDFHGVKYIVWEDKNSDAVKAIFEQLLEEANEEILDIQEEARTQIKMHSDTPKWSPTSGDAVPLSISDTVSIGLKWADQKWPDAKGHELFNVHLHPIAGNHWWAYTLTVMANSFDQIPDSHILRFIIVRMDGKVYSYRIGNSGEFVRVDED